MFRTTRYTLALIIFLGCGKASAGAYYTGQQLYDWCGGPEQVQRCIGYVMGATDTWLMLDSTKTDPTFCMDGFGEGDLVMAVLQVGKESPEDLEYGAAGLVLTALKSYFSCDWPE